LSRRSNWPSPVPSGEPTSRPERRDPSTENWSTGAPEHQSTNSNPVDEKRFRSRVEREMIRGRVPTQKAEKYRLFCHLMKIDMQDFLEEAGDLLLVKYGFGTGAPVLQCSTDHDLDDQIDDEKEETSSSSLFPEAGAPVLQPEERKEAEALAFYAKTTGNQVKERDRDAYREVADLPLHSFRAGVMQSVLLCRTRVNSLKYCLGAIREAAEAGMSEEIVNYLQSSFGKRLQQVKASRDQETLPGQILNLEGKK
jgi:hypothetical protein